MTMKKTLLAAGMLLAGLVPASAQDKLTLQLKWVTQAQFAGYYVAKDKGFYKEVGLDVTITMRTFIALTGSVGLLPLLSFALAGTHVGSLVIRAVGPCQDHHAGQNGVGNYYDREGQHIARMSSCWRPKNWW